VNHVAESLVSGDRLEAAHHDEAEDALDIEGEGSRPGSTEVRKKVVQLVARGRWHAQELPRCLQRTALR
jgi:hypothetical protein